MLPKTLFSSKIHFCDNLSLVSRSPDTYKKPAEASSFGFLKADYDVHMQIMALIREMDIDLPSQHVKGQQLNNKNLSYAAKLNI
jgi:hypothetical protein